eukprot:6224833-Alexandrium_andersonii.AAC.1
MLSRSCRGSRPAALARWSIPGYHAWSQSRSAPAVRRPRYSHWRAIGRTSSMSTPAASNSGRSR